jgi:hypothetical protein
MRKIASSTMAAKPMVSYPGRKAMPAVEVPSRNSEAVSLVPRPKRRWSAMKAMVPIGRAMKANEKTTKERRMPSSALAKGKNTDGNTSTEAIP